MEKMIELLRPYSCVRIQSKKEIEMHKKSADYEKRYNEWLYNDDHNLSRPVFEMNEV